MPADGQAGDTLPTQAQVFSVMQKMIDKEAVSVGGEKANGIKEAYIRISDREELA